MPSSLTCCIGSPDVYSRDYVPKNVCILMYTCRIHSFKLKGYTSGMAATQAHACGCAQDLDKQDVTCLMSQTVMEGNKSCTCLYHAPVLWGMERV